MPAVRKKPGNSAREIAGREKHAGPRLAGAGKSRLRIGTYVRAADDRDFVMSLARGLSVLLAFSEKWRHLSMAQVSHRTGISRAAVGRSLHTLCELGYVAVDESQRYFLRPKVMAFSHAYVSGNPLPALAQPVLDRLTDDLHQSCSLAILDGDEIVYLVRGTSSRIMSLQLNVGGRAPLYCSSIGLVLLAHFNEAELAGYLARVKLVRYTENTLADPHALRQALKGVRRNGYAIADQHREPRLCTMAVPVRSKVGAPFVGINVIVKSGVVPVQQMASRFLAPLQAAASELERVLNA
jgi:IclR family pca regulon transcriptional regulator